MVWGIALLICGILAITLPLATSIGVVIVLAWLLLFAGIVHIVFAFQRHNIGGVLWQVLIAITCGIAGIYMLINPFLGVLSLTLVLGTLFLLQGAFELAFYYENRRLGHVGWVLFDGIITMILGALIWAQWPSSSLWLVGTLVGISLIFSGISRCTLSFAARHAVATQRHSPSNGHKEL